MKCMIWNNKEETTINIYKNFPFVTYTQKETIISEASSRETSHLKKVPMENIYVNVVYISDTNL